MYPKGDVKVTIWELSVLMEDAWQVVWKPLIDIFQRGTSLRWNPLEKSLNGSYKNDY